MKDSQTLITKRALDIHNFKRPSFYFPNARSAFKTLLQALNFSQKEEVLLPAYIGWSKNEGSGVFDPIRELGVKFRFYRIQRNLDIDVKDFHTKLSSRKTKLLVVIHYFGFPDRNFNKVVELSRKFGVIIIEDEAHALYSDWIGGICGRLSNAAIFSLHKMLPFESGGLLIINSLNKPIINLFKKNSFQIPHENNLFDYDFVNIAKKRRFNAFKLYEMLRPLEGKINPLYPTIPKGVIPHTFPILTDRQLRDALYFRMNELGYGVVSLYHTLIEAIKESEFPDSHWISKRILNLPVHQDISIEILKAMVKDMENLL